ncbi:MAG: CDP-glycerol glycerophosphotransferase family protein [Eubacterium sp.]|nr:CDP-glycerol glycerophosphotransferase family protein [Eubacterium sp.]
MIKRLISKSKSIISNIQTSYLKYLELPVDEKLVLVEGGQGTNINGNMFSMLNELNTNDRWSEYKTVFVVTDDTISAAKKRMEFYGFDKVIISVRNSKQYCKYLATAKYLMTDNSFPPYFVKRDDQVFLNTWHGTPLKTLGKSDKSNNASLANIQKNYLMSDYALFPNEFTRNVFMEDYDLKYIFSGKSLIANYPRNYIFYDKEQAVKMKEKLGYKDKKIFAYMPTWRGTGRTADTDVQLANTKEILDELDKRLDDDTVILVNLHFLLASAINCDNYKHIDYFTGNYDTYEVLNACDGLITDYSSVFFDYAVTGKKIILYAYDKRGYLATRGVYIPFESLPFPILENVDDVVAEMKKDVEPYDDFVKEYCPNGSVESCEDLFEMMVNGTTDKYKLEDNAYCDKPLCLIYAGRLSESHYRNIRNYINENPEFNYSVVYRRNLNAKKKDFLYSLGDNVTTLGTITAFQFSFRELVEFALKGRKMKESSIMKDVYKREADRLLYGIKPDRIVDFVCGTPIFAGMFTFMTGDKYYINHGEFVTDSKKSFKRAKRIKAYEEKYGFKAVNYGETEDKLFLDDLGEEREADQSFRRNSRMTNILPLYLKTKNKLICFSSFKFRTPVKTRLKDTWLTVGDSEYPVHFIANKSRLSHSHYGFWHFSVPLKDAVDMPATNMVALNYKNSLNCNVQCHVVYTCMTLGRFLGLRGPILCDKQTNSVAIFRQSRSNRLNIYVRSLNVSDSLSKQLSQIIAFICSRFWFGKKAKGLVLLYEKNASKFEESASVLFEKLNDSGYPYAYFIITKEAADDVPEKYRDHVLIKHSFKHYLYFFRAYTFIGTETLVHSIDLKTFNKLALAKVQSKNKNYVFLQHGVMYMVSLDSESRGMFKRKNLNGKYRVVVSSQAECDHFTQLGRHYEEDIYITGLPKFDKNVLNDDADKITIMPTWRPWEINTARDNFLETSYFKMIMKIYDSVPENLKDKVLILPHPLIINELQKLPKSVTDVIVTEPKYDDILRQTRVLITDYSSIAYDAFYRGTRVIFYWEEKDECMAEYGPTTKLMLNEDNVYGDFFYNTDGLTQAIERNYNNEQPQEYKDKYSKIVEFHDGKNTERLIKFLKRDGII